MTPKDTENTPEEKRVADRRRLRKEILALSPEQALERILADPNPAALVGSFAEEDFYFLVHGIGAEDSLPLLAAAAPRQWEYLLDLEVWNRDRFDSQAAARWLRRMEKAAGPRLVRWMLAEKKDLFDLFLHRSIELRVREHDQDPSEFGEDFFTVDDVYYVRVSSVPAPTEAEKEDRHERDALIRKMIKSVAELDYAVCQSLLLEVSALLPAEAEEEAYRLRNVRLAEKGFAPPEEAVGVYQRLEPEALHHRSKKRLVREADPAPALPVPRFAEGVLDRQGLFARGLSAVDSAPVLLQLQGEFAGLCNCLIAADRTPVRERESLRAVVNKAAGYLSIALEHLAPAKDGEPAVRAARLVEQVPLVDLFRVGHGLALSLKWRARRWRQQSWFESEASFPLSFWDEAWVGVLGGLLLARPRYFDNYETGHLYREFSTLDDIKRTEQVLDQVIGTDRLLSRLNVEPAGPRPLGLTFKNLLLSLWAADELGAAPTARHRSLPFLPLETVRRFHRRLFPGRRVSAAAPRRIADRLKTEFVAWLSKRSGLDSADIAEELSPMLEALFVELEEELGAVAAEDLDPRFIRLFLIAAPDAEKTG